MKAGYARNLFSAVIVLAACAAVRGQVVVGNYGIQYVGTAPSGACSSTAPIQVVSGVGAIYTCQSGTWAQISGGGGTPTGPAGGDLTGTYPNPTVQGIANATLQATFSAAGAASTPGVSITGLPFAGTGTASTPQLYVNSGASAPTTWNANGTQIGVNAASGSTANFLDFHVNGGSGLFTVTAAGGVLASASTNTVGQAAPLASVLAVSSTVTTGAASSATGRVFSVASGTVNRVGDSGTTPVSATSNFGTPTLAAGAASTYTVACTLCIAGAPVAGTNVVITNPYALDVQAGNSFFGGSISAAGITTNGGRKGTFVCTGGGTITITNSLAIATSDIIITMNTAGGTITTPPAFKTPGNGTNFSVLCGATDTSTYNYNILN